ncbi:hypothetical protein [Kineosporia sp. NBRC 101731]|uniref:hypothetical protein n=1 Tax=Kineosporia sp. NBRC 101731 TaxID=3032199 RepID=UPI0024A202E5|nr:hypothetical protein [Kineosporia sp. NBRC 101731]GLY29638.1 hypothetical protein Kisp02_30030 [Kineosporia sp. NBRC 101731]
MSDLNHLIHLKAPEDMDGMMRMLLEVASEVWVMRDRFAVLEALLAERGTLSAGDLDRYQPGSTLAELLDRERAGFVRRLLDAGAGRVELGTP